jgi:FMN phosphatase YigB (HAD superfamily)
MPPTERVIFLLDVDNTLLDNDAVGDDLRIHLEREFGESTRDRYFAIFEKLRSDLGYADYLGALQQYRIENPHEPRLILMSSFLVNYPFERQLYPRVFDVITHLRQWGPTVILSDGDVVFQPRKVERSGLGMAVGSRVLIFIHKEKELDFVRRLYPAEHYVLVDDKLRILTAVKAAWGDAVTTVFPRQGHYALDPQEVAKYPLPDLTIDSVRNLLDHDLPSLIDPKRQSRSRP